MDTPNRFTSNHFTDLGRISYAECLVLQKKLVLMRKNEETGNIILFLEHPSTYTIGRKADPSNYPGIDPVRTERGGDVTYHGPGQVVAYFIFDSRINGKRDVGHLLRSVEKAVIESLSQQGYEIHIGEEPGFWNGDRKIGSLGMAMNDYVSYHGISINTGEEVIDGFSRINPCGLKPEVMSWIKVDRGKFRYDLAAALSVEYGNFIEISKSGLESALASQDRMPTSQIFS